MRPAIASGIVTGGRRGQLLANCFSPSLVTVPESLLLVSKVEKYCFKSILTLLRAFTHTHNAPAES